jgi:hypothetical protein
VEGVAADPLEPIALSGRDDEARMQVQPIPPGMAGAERPRIDRLARLTDTIKACPG